MAFQTFTHKMAIHAAQYTDWGYQPLAAFGSGAGARNDRLTIPRTMRNLCTM